MQGFGSSSKNVGKKKVPFGGLHPPLGRLLYRQHRVSRGLHNGFQGIWIWRLFQQDRGFLGSKIHLSPHAFLLV